MKSGLKNKPFAFLTHIPGYDIYISAGINTRTNIGTKQGLTNTQYNIKRVKTKESSRGRAVLLDAKSFILFDEQF